MACQAFLCIKRGPPTHNNILSCQLEKFKAYAVENWAALPFPSRFICKCHGVFIFKWVLKVALYIIETYFKHGEIEWLRKLEKKREWNILTFDIKGDILHLKG